MNLSSRQEAAKELESTYSLSHRVLVKGELKSMRMMMSENQLSWTQVHVTAILLVGTDQTTLRIQIQYATSQVKEGGGQSSLMDWSRDKETDGQQDT